MDLGVRSNVGCSTITSITAGQLLFKRRGGFRPRDHQHVVVFGGSDNHVQPLPDTWIWGPAPPPTPTSVVSSKTHGNAGTFDIQLPLTGKSGIECRSGGSNGVHTVIFTFPSPLTSVGDVRVTGGTGSVQSSAINNNDPREYIVNLTGVANAQPINIVLSDVTDVNRKTSSAVSVPIAFLVGDINATGALTNADVSLVKAQVAAGGSLNLSNFRNDVNANGGITNADVSVVKAQVAAGAQLR